MEKEIYFSKMPYLQLKNIFNRDPYLWCVLLKTDTTVRLALSKFISKHEYIKK